MPTFILAFEMSKNAVIGAMSGATFGLGDSLINNENPIETMLRYAVINSIVGAGAGAIGYKVGKNVIKLNKEKINNGTKQRRNDKTTNKRFGTEDERVRNIRRLYTTDDGNIRPYTSRSYGSGSTRLVVHEPNEVLKTEYKKFGWRVDNYYELNNNMTENFVSAFKNANEYQGKWSAQVYEYSIEEYKNMRLFLSENGTSGFAIKNDGDIVSVFSTAKGSSKAMLELAIQNGGRKLDCFDTYLPKMYKQHGFKEVYREKWNEKYKPKGWDKEFYKQYNNGEPDVVYMELEL